MSSNRPLILAGALAFLLTCPLGCAHVGNGSGHGADACDACLYDDGCSDDALCACDAAPGSDSKCDCGDCACVRPESGADVCPCEDPGSCGCRSRSRSSDPPATDLASPDGCRCACKVSEGSGGPACANGPSTCRVNSDGNWAPCQMCGGAGQSLGGNCPGCGCGRPGLRGRLLGFFAGHHRSMAIPETLPLGSTVRAHYQVMETNGEAADFIFHRHDFVGQTAQLTPDARDKILEVAVRMKSAPFPVLVERSENNSDPELDMLRRNLVAQILTEYGVPDADCRTVVSPAYGRGFTGVEAEATYYRHVLQGTGTYNRYGAGFGNGVFGGAGFGGGAFGGGLGVGGLGY